MLARVTLLLPLLLLAQGVSVRQGSAATLVAQATQDSTLYQNNTNASNGQGWDLYVGKTGQAGGFSLRRGLIEFDLAAIPVGSTVTSVTLTMTMTLSGSKSTPVDASHFGDPISVYQVLAAWGEGTSSAAAAGGLGVAAHANDATWTSRYYGTSQIWTNAGGDFDPVASATKNVGQVASSSGIPYNWVGAGLQGDVQEWVNNPATNFGWIIRGDELLSESARRFATAENPMATWRPKLTVIYTVPEPRAAALICTAGGLLMARRRRRDISVWER